MRQAELLNGFNKKDVNVDKVLFVISKLIGSLLLSIMISDTSMHKNQSILDKAIQSEIFYGSFTCIRVNIRILLNTCTKYILYRNVYI